jgi:hypothetical protein
MRERSYLNLKGLYICVLLIREFGLEKMWIYDFMTEIRFEVLEVRRYLKSPHPPDFVHQSRSKIHVE